jgi:hypothetical protein
MSQSCAESFRKLATSNLNGFEILLIGCDQQFSFETRATQRPPLLKAGQWQSRWFEKAFSKFKSFWC